MTKSNVKTSGGGGAGGIGGILNMLSGGSFASSLANKPIDDGNPRSMIRPYEKKFRQGIFRYNYSIARNVVEKMLSAGVVDDIEKF